MFARNRIRSALRRLASFAQAGLPIMSNPERVDGVPDAVSLHPSARFTIVDAGRFPSSRIVLGRGVYVGRYVELTAAQGGSVAIGDDTSLQDGCLISGDVRIGAHCLFGKYIFVGSTHHRFADKPAWLIRDQDAYIPSHPAEAVDAISRPVRIEDDCWIGQGVVIQPGVYVGRGAVIGANSVVTTDIGPYEIHGGVPNRKIGTRLVFAPPRRLEAQDDDATVYFYRGFRLTQADLAKSRVHGVVEGFGKTCLLLAHGAGAFHLRGRRFDATEFRLRINGAEHGTYKATSDVFDWKIELAGKAGGDIPAPLRAYTCIEIEALIESGAPACYGISLATFAE